MIVPTRCCIAIVLSLIAITLCLSQDSLLPNQRIDSGRIPAVKDSVFTVGNITIVGNTHTLDFVVLREMTLRPGTLITEERVAYDRDRIYSLGLFNEVKITVIPSSPAQADLVVEVSERWYIFPYPIIGLRDRDWSKLFYGVGLLHTNFRGRNEKLSASLVLGYDPSVSLSYRNPFLDQSGTEFLEARISYNTITNKSLLAEQSGGSNFDERHFSVSSTFGVRIGIAQTAWVGLGYELVKVDTYEPGRTLSIDGTDRYPIFGAGYAYDSRDLIEYPSSGLLARATITKNGWPGNNLDFIRYAADFRYYQPLLFGKTVVLANRVFTDLVAAGPTPTYNHVYFGYGERIRGHYRDVLEGEDIFGVSTELHFALLAPRYFSVRYLPAEFAVWRFGVVAALFGDAGTTWFRGTPVSLNSFVRGYGVGLNFLFPYSSVLRTECAWNEARQGQFIIDLGANF